MAVSAGSDARSRIGVAVTGPFERGFREAIRMWRAGITWESITHLAESEAPYVARGMVAAVEAMSGWLSLAEREAKAHGVPPATIDTLIQEARHA